MNDVAGHHGPLYASQNYYHPDKSHNMQFKRCELLELIRIFLVEDGAISVDSNPADIQLSVLKTKYTTQVNTAAAVSSYLNRDFYEDAPAAIAAKIQFTPNVYSYILSSDYRRVVYASFDQNGKEPFIERLKEHAEHIQYVVRNPSILFLRPQLNFTDARAHLERGFAAFPQPV